jgi:hypothetical protein
MRLMITKTTQLGTDRLAVAVNPSKFFHDSTETPIDIILGYLMHAFEDRRELHEMTGEPVHALRSLQNQGLRNHRSLVMAEALDIDDFRLPFDPTDCITLHFDATTKTITTHHGDILRTEDLGEMPIDRAPLRTQPSRQPHPFHLRYAGSDDCHPIDHDAGSITSGLFSALIGQDFGRYSTEIALLVGLLLAHSDRPSQGHGMRQTDQASTLEEMRRHFFRNGRVVSDRAWCPRLYLEGEGLEDCIEMSQPALVGLGRKIAQHAHMFNKTVGRIALEDYLDRNGLTERDISYIPARGRFDPSAHDLMQGKALLQTLADTIGVDV